MADEPAEADKAVVLAATELGVAWLCPLVLEAEAEPEVLGEPRDDEADAWLTPRRPFQLNDIVRV